ncbi:MAG: ribosome small subunit-dependent GTPase A [Desulfuromonadaceae bacterium]|nr:ribosome small subunit-dependent GTPase A [Desulfuromonadaceae bacterium]MDD2856566.1 ribosome small subunit-dependent GTPase A [Desulfuromonadaceae bacterium]
MSSFTPNGLIVAHHGISVEVLFNNGSRRMVRVKRNSGHVVGDGVTVTGEVLNRLARRTELQRRDARGGIHLVAANLDVLGIVVAPQSPGGFIDRAIVAARAARLEPFLLVNKCDLDESAELLAELKALYTGSLPVFPISATDRIGLENVEKFLSSGYRGAFVGTTGVGKSSLLNALCPDIDLKVGRISDYKSIGRHTTTVSTLHALAGGGELVDTPGFRDFGLVDITVEELAEYFPGFEEHQNAACRFRNCRHRTEPGCAVLELVKSSRIPAARYEAYMDILKEVENQQEAARSREWKNS